MKKYFFLFVLGLIFLSLPAYAVKTDSLIAALPKAKADTVKVNMLQNIAVALQSSDPSQSLKYAEEAMALAENLNFSKGYYKALNHTGIIARMQGRNEEAIAISNSVLAWKEINSQPVLKGSALTGLGIIYKTLSAYEKSIDYYHKALHAFESADHKRGMASCYNNIASINDEMKQFSKAVENYKKANLLFREAKDSSHEAITLINLSNSFIKMNRPDSAFEYISSVLAREKIKEDTYTYASALLVAAGIYQGRKEYPVAQSYYTEALDIFKNLGDKEYMIGCMGNIGLIEVKTGQIHSGIKQLEAALAMARETGSPSYVNSILIGLHEAYAKNKDFGKAYTALEELYKSKDSLLSHENEDKLAKLQIVYETEKKDNDLKTKTALIEKQELARNIIVLSSAALFCIVILSGWIFFQRRRTAFNRKVKDVEMMALRAQMNPHFIFNALHSINQYVLKHDREVASEFLSKFAKLMRMILENSREQFVPLASDLETAELYLALEQLRFRNKFNYHIRVEEGIDKEITLIPPMLLQPFLENAILHGIQHKDVPGNIRLHISKQGNQLVCTIEDDGVGRDQANTMKITPEGKKESLGMKITRDRIQLLSILRKATATIDISDIQDAVNKVVGTRVQLLLPLELDL